MPEVYLVGRPKSGRTSLINSINKLLEPKDIQLVEQFNWKQLYSHVINSGLVCVVCDGTDVNGRKDAMSFLKSLANVNEHTKVLLIATKCDDIDFISSSTKENENVKFISCSSKLGVGLNQIIKSIEKPSLPSAKSVLNFDLTVRRKSKSFKFSNMFSKLLCFKPKTQ